MSADNLILLVEVPDGVEIYDVNFSSISSEDYWCGLSEHTDERLYDGIRNDYKQSFCKKVKDMKKAKKWYKDYINNYVCEYGHNVIEIPESRKAGAAQA